MRRLLLLSLTVLTLLGLVGPLPPSGVGRVAAAAPLSGSQSMYGVVEAFQAPDQARKSGAKWQRIAFFWNSIQPDSADQWNSNHYSTDADVRQAVADGIQPVGLLGNPPEWATRNGSVPKNLSLSIDDPDNYWARFVKRIVTQYAGQIDDWIIWNEPDIQPGQPGSTWAGSEAEYYQLMKTAALAARSVNPKARIVFAGTTYWYDFNRGNKQFFERVLEIAKADPTAASNGYFFDAVDVHLYSSPEQIPVVAKAIREILGRFALNKAIWMSELNVVPTNDQAALVPRGGYRASLEEQASYILEALALVRYSGVERASVYKMKDGEVINGEPYGLIRNDLSLRPAFLAYQVAAQYLTIPGDVTSERKGDAQQVVIDGGNRRVTVLWARGPASTTVRVAASGSRAKLIARDGTTTDLSGSLTGGSLGYTVKLEGATANTDDGNPNNYIIGGSPVILYEEGVSEAIPLSASEVYFTRTGFTSAGAFLDYFNHRGGIRAFGYPVSRPFRLEGRTVQFYQRQVMELRSDNTVGLINILDEGYMPYTKMNGATFPSIDSALTKTAPLPGTPDYGKKILDYAKSTAPDVFSGIGVNFGRTFAGTVSAQDAFGSAKADPGVVAGLNLEMWGVPTSRPARDPKNDNFVYQRFQRGVMHFDRATGRTQGLLLADYLKAIITGADLPADLDSQAAGSRLYHQYDPSRASFLARPAQLPNTDLTNAFEPGN